MGTKRRFIRSACHFRRLNLGLQVPCNGGQTVAVTTFGCEGRGFESLRPQSTFHTSESSVDRGPSFMRNDLHFRFTNKNGNKTDKGQITN